MATTSKRPTPTGSRPRCGHGSTSHQTRTGSAQNKTWEVAEHLITVDASGLIRWQRSAADIPYADVVRAGDRGLLHGDPLRPYLVLLLPQGPDVLHIAWDGIVLTWTVIGHLLTARELLKIGLKRRQRLEQGVRAAEVLQRYGSQWSERGGGPHELQATLERRPWTPDDLRMLLGLATIDEAVDLLAGYGLSPNAAGTYELAHDDESRLLRDIGDEAGRGRLDPRYPELDTEERLRTALETGDLPP